ncbi:hypothetical protein GCM10027435_23860 [Haloparvum alkalitolerans]
MTDSDDEENGSEAVRQAVEESRHGAPAVGAVVRDRFETDEVFQRIVAAADDEIDTPFRELFFSALAAGFAITLTFLMYASLYGATDGHPILKALLYPIGFIYIIIGGYQLYTENTLPPVALVLERLASVPALLRVWLVVMIGNFVGGGLGALVLAYSGVFSPAAAEAAMSLSQTGLETPFWDLFFKAGFAGFIVAGVVWMDFASRDTISRLVLIYIAFLCIPLANLFHVVVSFTELMYLFFLGEAALLPGLTTFVFPVLLGNTIGGVLLVTVVNYFQTSESRRQTVREGQDVTQLTLGELTMGARAGRTYVPVEPDERSYTQRREEED